jgi:hypothetical protein
MKKMVTNEQIERWLLESAEKAWHKVKKPTPLISLK